MFSLTEIVYVNTKQHLSFVYFYGFNICINRIIANLLISIKDKMYNYN